MFQRQELRSQAVPATTLAFDPQSATKTVGETFALNITINTGSNSVSSAELHIQYDSTRLTALSISPASNSFLPLVLVNGSVSGNLAFITLGSEAGKPQRGQGTLATITFRANAPTGGVPTLVRFTIDTLITAVGETGNVLASQPASAAITVNQASPTPTSATQAPNPTPSGISPFPTPTTGSVGIGQTAPTVIPRGGPPAKSQASAAGIPVTSEIVPTVLLITLGVSLFLVGAVSLLFF